MKTSKNSARIATNIIELLRFVGTITLVTIFLFFLKRLS